MFIQTESTPNPSTLKFIPGEPVLGVSTANFTSKEEAAESPLALALFDNQSVTGVFLGSDFISVTKDEGIYWEDIKTEILTAIMEHYVAGKPIMNEVKAAAIDEDEDETVTQIRELIDTRVRPSVAQDGGDIIFRGFENGIVKLEMHGACSGCPSSSITLKNGIEGMLKHYIPEIESVEAVEA
jgi:Fe-S cluster biogenesis protein NfuA